MIATKLTGLSTSPQNQQNPIKNVEPQEKKNSQEQQHEHNNETRSEKLLAANIGQQQDGERIAGSPGKQEVVVNQPASAASTKIQLKQQKFLAAAAKCSATPISAFSAVVGSNKRTAANVASAQDRHQAPRTALGSSEQRRRRADELGATQLAAVVTTPLSVARRPTSPTAIEATNATTTATAANTREPVVAQGLLQQAPMSTNLSSAPASTHSQRSQQQLQQQQAQTAAATSTNLPAAAAEASALSEPQQPPQMADAQILIENSERRADFAPSKTQTTLVSAELEGERRQRVRIGGSSEIERTGNENAEAQQPSRRERLHNLNISNNNYNQNHHHHHHHHHNHHQHQHHYNNNNNNHHHHHHQHNHHQQFQQHQNQQNYHQQQHNQHQHTMAHYKFHNDCQSSVLTYEQVKRLDFVMDQTVPIHGRGKFPTLYVKLKELIRLVKYKLQTEHSIEIRDVRLNGGAASFVLAPENSHYNDLDLIFGTDLSNEDQFDVIRDVVLECLTEFYPKEQHQQHQQEEHYFDSEPLREAKIAVVEDGGQNFGETNGCLANFVDNRASSMSCRSSGSDLKSTINETDCDDNDRIEDSDEDVENDDGLDRNRRVEKRLTGSGGFIKNQTSAREHKSIEGSANSTGENQQSAQPMQNFQYQHQSYQMPLNTCAIKEAYVHKMVKVNDDDRWSLISLGVQQSEASCCANQSAITTTNNNNNCPSMHHVGCRQQQHYQQTQQQQIAACVTTNENEPRSGLINQSSAHMVSNENSLNAQTIIMSGTQQQQYQPSTNYIHQPNQRDHYQQQQKQFPNSIELKFVDRMRRKFEFSVDSFQIILDSLLQFYDYAPQSTITSQRKLINSHPSSTMINIRPMINRKRCSVCCADRTVLGCKIYNSNLGSLSKANMHRENHHHHHHHHHHHNHTNQNHSHQQQANNGFSETKPCSSVLNGSRSYYQLPIDSENSPSISSVASSSGCSSSSSVVSSSSSSLSCDEDHEDLYCDADCPSSTSSSASTSSLLSSTNSSSLSADGNSNDVSVGGVSCLNENIRNQDSVNPNQAETSGNRLVHRQNQSNSKEHSNKNSLNGGSCGKSKSVNADFGRIPASSEANSVECIEFFNHQQNLINDVCHFEMNNRTSCAVISENFYPTVIGRSEYGNFKEALYHLEKKLIATRSPEEIRGGGLLKYCNLLVKTYKPTNVYQIRTLERYMCSRFFIDFSDLNQQQAKLESYLANHFSDDPVLKFEYLTILHNVVQRSTVCLMNHELKLTLNMIRDLAYKLNEQQQHQHQHQQHQHQQHQHQQHQRQQQLSSAQHFQQSTDHAQAQHNQHHYYQQKPVLIQSGVYRVKLVNYALAKTSRS